MTTLFKKPKLEPKEYLKKIEEQILVKTEMLENLDEQYRDKSVILLATYGKEKEQLQKELTGIENVLGILRQERIELEKPIIEKTVVLVERENAVAKREETITQREQKVFEGERGNESKLESIKELSNQLGEEKISHMVKGKTLIHRENLLKTRETEYLAEITAFNEWKRQEVERIKNREYVVSIDELNVQSKEENLVKREKELTNGFILLTDQRETLARAWKELERKQHDGSKRAKR